MPVKDKMLPKRLDLDQSRQDQSVVNNDDLFLEAQTQLKVKGSVLYNMCACSSVGRARVVLAFVVALYIRKYFEVDRKTGKFDPDEKRMQARAVFMFMSMIEPKDKQGNPTGKHRPMYLGSLVRWKAEKYFYLWYPEYKKVLEAGGTRTEIPYPYNPELARWDK
jgi:hypothetical protein